MTQIATAISRHRRAALVTIKASTTHTSWIEESTMTGKLPSILRSHPSSSIALYFNHCEVIPDLPGISHPKHPAVLPILWFGSCFWLGFWEMLCLCQHLKETIPGRPWKGPGRPWKIHRTSDKMPSVRCHLLVDSNLKKPMGIRREVLCILYCCVV